VAAGWSHGDRVLVLAAQWSGSGLQL